MMLEAQMPISMQLRDVEPLLIIDDSMTARKIMRKLLIDVGIKDIIEIEKVTDIATLRQKKINFIICDVEMAPINGIQFAAALKQDPELNKVPILLVTGSKNIEYARYVRRLGISGMLLKPFCSQKLYRAIKLTKTTIKR